MTFRRLIQPQANSGPTSTGTPRRTADRAIPADLLREASKRLSIMALLAAILWIVATILWHISWQQIHPEQPLLAWRLPDTIATAAAASSFALFIYIRRAKRTPEYFLKLGLAYMIVTCFWVAIVLHVDLPVAVSLEPVITWVGVVLLMFAAIAPNEPRTMLVAALIAASMNPLAMLITHGYGLNVGETLRAGMLMHYPDFLLAGIAGVIARVVTRLGRQVSKAREMGSYQLGDLIKRGGMGEVYRATHRMLARPAAIKLIRSEMLGAQDGETADLAVQRFHREAEAAANLRSPHTVELFDFGITEDQTLYFVMELLDGKDLETLVREHGPLPARRVIHILAQACESLEEAHAQGLVHRDIKPANIHLGKVGVKYDFVKVLDFGLVKSVSKDDTQISLATAVGRTPGTPSYMAPEMALGESVDARADIYALGCVAYFLLTAKLVFDAETTFQMVAKHLRNQPVPPSLRAGVEVPLPLEDLVMKCLAKQPDARPSTASELRKALEAIRIPKWTEAESLEWWTVHRAQPSPSGKDSAPMSPVVPVLPDTAGRFARP